MKKIILASILTILISSCGLQVQKSRPLVRFNPTLNSDNSYSVDLGDSLNFNGKSSDLEFQFTFFSDGIKSDKTLGYKDGSEFVGDYQVVHLANGGILYVGGTYETPIFYYVGGPSTTIVDFCATARDTISEESDTECISLAFTSTTPPIPGNPKVTINQNTSQLDATNTLPVIFDVIFDQPINPSTFTAADIVQNGIATGVTWIVIDNGDHQHFTVQATAATSYGTLIPTVTTGSVSNHYGATNSASTSTDNSVNYDNTFSVGGSVAGLSGSVVLQNNAGDDITINANGTFTFPTEIAVGATYSVTVKSSPCTQRCTATVNTGTMGLANVTNVSVNCVSKSWDDPALITSHISLGGTTATAPDVAVNASGDAVIAWQQSDGTNTQIYKAELTNGTWTYPTNIFTDRVSFPGSDVSRAKVSINDSGEAVIAWIQADNEILPKNQIFVATRTAGGVWSTPASLGDYVSAIGEDVSNHEVVIDNNGDIVIAYLQNTGAKNQVYKAERRSGVWANAIVSYNNGKLLAAFNPQVEMDNLGNAIIAWRQSTKIGAGTTCVVNTGSSVFKAEYRSGAWMMPSTTPIVTTVEQKICDEIVSMKDENPSTAFDTEVAMADDGSAIIVWRQKDGGFDHVYKSEYPASGPWTTPNRVTDKLSTGSYDINNPEVKKDDNGHTLVVWHQSDGVNNHAYTAENRGMGWQVQLNHSFAGQNVTNPHADMNTIPQESIIVWNQSDGATQQIFRSEYRSNTWTDPTSLSDFLSPSMPSATSAGNPRVAMSEACTNIITWNQSNGSTEQIFISWYH